MPFIPDPVMLNTKPGLADVREEELCLPVKLLSHGHRVIAQITHAALVPLFDP